MRELTNKINKLNFLAKIRKSHYLNELHLLSQLRNEKQNIIASMRKSQQKYLTAIEELNKIRTSSTRENLETYESSVDYLKSIWFNHYKELKNIEQKESIQLSKLREAEMSLKSVETMSENFALALDENLKRQEQKALDEFVILSKTSGFKD